MKTRKILSGISALVIAVAMAVPFSAFADDTTTKTINTDGGSDSTNVIYDATEKYFVTIPAGVTLKDTAVTANITASDVINELKYNIKWLKIFYLWSLIKDMIRMI